MSLKIRFQKNWSYNAWEVFVFDSSDYAKKFKITITSEIKEKAQRFEAVEPVARLEMSEAEDFIAAMIEGLSEAGLLSTRPGDVAHVESIKYHLEDMRKLVFKDNI